MILDITNNRAVMRFQSITEVMSAIQQLAQLASFKERGWVQATPEFGCVIEDNNETLKHSPGTIRYVIGD